MYKSYRVYKGSEKKKEKKKKALPLQYGRRFGLVSDDHLRYTVTDFQPAAIYIICVCVCVYYTVFSFTVPTTLAEITFLLFQRRTRAHACAWYIDFFNKKKCSSFGTIQMTRNKRLLPTDTFLRRKLVERLGIRVYDDRRETFVLVAYTSFSRIASTSIFRRRFSDKTNTFYERNVEPFKIVCLFLRYHYYHPGDG